MREVYVKNLLGYYLVFNDLKFLFNYLKSINQEKDDLIEVNHLFLDIP